MLLDLNLPDSAGLDTIGRMLAAAPGVPIVVLTATAESDLAVAAVQHGAQDYLVKSETDSRYLSRALRYAIERAGFQAELVNREQQFRALIERAHDIVVLLGLDGFDPLSESRDRTGAGLLARGTGRRKRPRDRPS